MLSKISAQKVWTCLFFIVFAGITPIFPEWQLEIDDPLTNGQTVGQLGGGGFTENGWKTKTRLDYIQYDIETCSYGRIEFDVQGLYASNEVFPNIYYDGNKPTDEEDMHYTLFNMWDRDENNLWFGKSPNGIRQWHNPWKMLMHVFGYVKGDKWKWRHGRFRLNVGAYWGGYDDDPHAFELEYGPVYWEQDRVFHVELEWGNGHMHYSIDGELLSHCDYSSFGVEYAPPEHSMRLGSAQKGCKGFDMQVPLQITYSNFKFYRNFDKTPPTITDFNPGHHTTDNKLDSYIVLHVSESFDLESAIQAFSITPTVAGEVKKSGTTIYYELAELLQPNTDYTITLDTQFADQSGLHLESPFTATFSTGSDQSKVIEKWGIFELPIIAENVSGNHYKDISLQGVFQGPSETISIDGFWNGGNVWKIRMTPNEVGTWSYTLSGNHSAFNRSGSFQVVDSNKKGHIHTNPENPYTFMWDDGTPFLWKGETCWRGFTALFPFEGRFKEYIDMRHSQGYNVVQSIVVSFINGDAFWANEGGTVFELKRTGKDYDNLNPKYFEWMDRRIEYMNSLDMVPVIFFTWAQEFIKFSDDQFKRFCEYMVARFAAYNVFWCISGEHSEAYVDFGLTPEAWRQHGETIYNADPYKHLISLHPGGGHRSSRQFARDYWFGFIMQQSPDFHSLILNDRQWDIPVVSAENAYAGWTVDDDAMRRAAWEVYTAGGFSTAGFFHTFAPDKGGYDPEANMQQQLEMIYFFNFIEHTKWWKMFPHDELTSNGYCLADPGEEYVIYSYSGGPVTVNLSAVNGETDIQWLDPYTGEYSQRSAITGGTTVTLAPPFDGEWALHIGGTFDVDAPAAPTGLILSKP